ncbi:MAG: DUF4340 domain-containing protein [Deltaproteobacteria bacterium]|nr:DUF4340 domain-containing protein [Deltaproteobacteria bacterium]
MSPKSTLLMAIVVAVLGAFIWFWEVEGADERAAAEQTEKEIFADLKAEEVTSLWLKTTDDQAVRLERTAEGWALREPLEFPADGTAADALADAVADLVTDKVFDDPEPLENYGLAGEPDVRAAAGEGEVALTLGDSIPTGGNSYVKAEGDARVFTVPTYRLGAMRKSLSDLRDSRVLDFDRDAVRDVEVTWVGGGVALAKEGEVWRLRKPLDAEANESAISGLLSDLRFLRAEGYVDEPDEAQAAAFESPAYGVILRGEGDAILADLQVASAANGSNRVAKGRDGYLYEIAESRLDNLPRTVVAYRFKELSRFEVNDAARFELRFRDAGEDLTIQARQTEQGAWETEPEALAPGKASRLLSELSGLEALDIAAESMGENELAALGLSPPSATLRVFSEGEGSEPLAELHLGRIEAGRGIAAQRPEDPIVYWLDGALAEHLPVSLEAWRNRFMAKETPPEVLEEDSSEGAEEGAPEE